MLTEKKKQNRISSQHASFSRNYTSGALVVTREFYGEQRTIWTHKTRLTFGRLDYKLILEPISDSELFVRLMYYKTKHGIKEPTHPLSLMCTPAESDYILRDYIFKDSLGNGTSSVVFAGEHRKTGNAVAIKKIKRTVMTSMFIKRDVAKGNYLGSHMSIAAPLITQLW